MYNYGGLISHLSSVCALCILLWLESYTFQNSVGNIDKDIFSKDGKKCFLIVSLRKESPFQLVLWWGMPLGLMVSYTGADFSVQET